MTRRELHKRFFPRLGPLLRGSTSSRFITGTSEQRLSNGTDRRCVNQITQLQTGIANIRDANVAQDATDLSQESASQQAAIEAQAEVPQKSLFDYLA